MEDSRIVELYRQKDPGAITESNLKYGTYCFAIANNILHSHEDSEECVNDTWLQTWNSIPPAHPSDLRTYLGKITRNLSINRLKYRMRAKRGGGQTELALDELGEIAAPDSDIASQIAKQDFVRILNKFLWSLPERDCNIFIRRYYFADSPESIAKRYRISHDAVLKILSRARKKLKASLEEEGYTV